MLCPAFHGTVAN
jgi:hypothetical protein